MSTTTGTIALTADLATDRPARLVRPGTERIYETTEHDGVIKAKQLIPNLVVRAFLHGEPKGGERIVKSVTPSEDGGTITVEFSSLHPTTDYKAAYRFYVPGLAGTPILRPKTVPALVDYQEV